MSLDTINIRPIGQRKNLMSLHRRQLAILPVFAITIAALAGCDGKINVPGTQETVVPAPEIDTRSYTEQIKELYDRAKDAGENVPEDVLTWAKDDVKKIGTWEYKIETFTNNAVSEEDTLKKLQELGGLRWECFWVEDTPEAKRFYFKKPVRSYIQRAGKVVPLIPTPGSGE
jgi:hypothetical protein